MRAGDRLQAAGLAQHEWARRQHDRLGVANTVGSNVIVWAPVRILARSMAPRRLSSPDGRAVAGGLHDQRVAGMQLEGADVGIGRVERLAALVGGDGVVVPG